MKSITIKISTYPEGKEFRGIYLNGSLVSTELEYSTNLVNTLMSSAYNFKTIFGDMGTKLISVLAETNDVNQVQLRYNNVSKNINLPYSTNTMASSITLDMTGLIPVGYTFDGYYDNNDLLTSNLSYTVPIDFESSEPINITIKTTPYVVVPVQASLFNLSGWRININGEPFTENSTNVLYNSLNTNVAIGSLTSLNTAFTLYDGGSPLAYSRPIAISGSSYSISGADDMGSDTNNVHYFISAVGGGSKNINYTGSPLSVSGENKTTAPDLSITNSEEYVTYYLGTKKGSITGNVGGSIIANIETSAPSFALSSWSSYGSTENFVVSESEFSSAAAAEKNALGIVLSSNASYELQVDVSPQTEGVGLTLSSASIVYQSGEVIKHSSISGNIITFNIDPDSGSNSGKAMLIIQASTNALPVTYNFSAEAATITELMIAGSTRTLPYTTNTTSALAINATDAIPLGYGYDGIYKNGSRVSTALSYTLPYEYSSSAVNIQIRTTPWVLGNLQLTLPSSSPDYNQGNLSQAVGSSSLPRVRVLVSGSWKETNLEAIQSGANAFEIKDLSPASPTTGGITIISTSASYWPAAKGVTVPTQLKGKTTPADFDGAPIPASVSGNNVTLSTTVFPRYNGVPGQDYHFTINANIPAVSGETPAALGQINVNFNSNSTYIKIGTLEGAGSGVTATVNTTPILTIDGSNEINGTAFDIEEDTFIGYLPVNNQVGAGTVIISTGTDSQAWYTVSSASLKHSNGTVVQLSVSSNYITIPQTTVSAGKVVSINIEGSFVYQTKSLKVSAESTDIKQIKVDGATQNLPYNRSLSAEDFG